MGCGCWGGVQQLLDAAWAPCRPWAAGRLRGLHHGWLTFRLGPSSHAGAWAPAAGLRGWKRHLEGGDAFGF